MKKGGAKKEGSPGQIWHSLAGQLKNFELYPMAVGEDFKDFVAYSKYS